MGVMLSPTPSGRPSSLQYGNSGGMHAIIEELDTWSGLQQARRLTCLPRDVFQWFSTALGVV